MTADLALAVSAAALVLAALAVESGRARRRLARWPVLAARSTPSPDDVTFLTAPEVRLDDTVRRAAAARLVADDLDALDLVPEDLGIAAALELASLMDPAALGNDAFARTAGAGHAIAVRESLRLRAAVDVPTDAPSLAAAAEQLRRHAVGRTGTAIARGLRAIPEPGGQRSAMLRARAGAAMGPRLYVEGIRWVLTAAALAADPRVGLIVLGLRSLGPSLVFFGLPLRPRDWRRSLVDRVPRDLLAWMRACIQPEPRAAAIDRARPRYRELIADGTAPFFSPRRARCPLCGGSQLALHMICTDLVQRKPGRFSLERCAGCGLILQNPALSPQGLAYYYRDFYDGLNADVMDEVFASTSALYDSRLDTVLAGGAAPTRWLDLGCGYGHFSLAARRRLPAARFEGLDHSSSVEDARRRGWIDRAWRMTTDQLVRTGERYDLVSLFHYLEHTQDPAAEISLAAQLLTPGGRLVIEIPNPRCRLGRLLGRWWFPWFQPQHQVFLDEVAVCRLLAAAGLKTTSMTYLMTADDVLLAALLAVRRACSPGDVPWSARPGALRGAADLAIWAAALPLFVVALVAGRAYSLLPPSQDTSNAMRIVAVSMEG